MYVYIRTDTNLYIVGFYDPAGNWYTEDDFYSKDEAAARVHFLNGGSNPESWINYQRGNK